MFLISNQWLRHLYILTLQFLGDVQTVRPKRKGGKSVVISNYALLTKQREISNQENCNEDSYQGCEILSFMDFPTIKNSKWKAFKFHLITGLLD